MGQRDLHDLPSRAFDQVERRAKQLRDLWLDSFGLVGEVRRDSEPEAREIAFVRYLDAARDARRGRVARVAALHFSKEERGVFDVAGQGTALVERGGEGDHAV